MTKLTSLGPAGLNGGPAFAISTAPGASCCRQNHRYVDGFLFGELWGDRAFVESAMIAKVTGQLLGKSHDGAFDCETLLTLEFFEVIWLFPA